MSPPINTVEKHQLLWVMGERTWAIGRVEAAHTPQDLPNVDTDQISGITYLTQRILEEQGCDQVAMISYRYTDGQQRMCALIHIPGAGWRDNHGQEITLRALDDPPSARLVCREAPAGT